ncbi:MAG: DUF6495 family protein [Crocinitomicaceae bacterium]|jgi:hypothetical protein|nr:DUF6495 family protein [Crocinitomicaceae bacterium]MDP4739079.1 DUF6495 family protein [Crocinitomicaceae bacterium]MDP4799761.1 DUF6495 family protein [Crocinitomicaceae bacterium]MDP4806122.1 DUF6495 family protein [Crocinitomicaceae bacterium]
MLKFRSLTPQELSELETEFKHFLVINELYDAEWRELAAKHAAKAQEFIDLFADIVLEKAYTQMPGLLQIGDDFITVFDLRYDIWNFYHFQWSTAVNHDEITPENWLELIEKSWTGLTLKKGSKKSSEHKAEEVFALICKGAAPLHPQILQDFLQLFSAK